MIAFELQSERPCNDTHKANTVSVQREGKETEWQRVAVTHDNTPFPSRSRRQRRGEQREAASEKMQLAFT